MFREECEDLAGDIALWMQGVEDPDYPLDEVGALTREVCGNLRSLAIMVLLARGKSDRFQHNLIRSGRLRLAFLQRAARENATDDHDAVCSVVEPVLDAIAAADFALAQTILAASSQQFRPGHEYEDDHCYAQMLACLLAGPTRYADLAPLLDRMAAYLGRDDDPRALVCQALAGGDGERFAKAFQVFLEARGEEITADEERGQLAEPPVLAQRLVYVDALAMLRLAEQRGFATEPEYLYCPSLARRPMVEPYPED